MEILKQANR